MIQEAYCSFEVSKLLKEKGFPQNTFRCHYIIDNNSHYKIFEDRCGFSFECIIPKGAEYYENELGEIVSNQIIIESIKPIEEQ